MQDAPITTLLLIAIVGSSLYAWNNREFYSKMVFHPVTVSNDKSQWYRFLSSGFVHADYMHLGFNCYTFYSFGKWVEFIYAREFGPQIGTFLYLASFILGVIVSSVPAYLKNKDNHYYTSLGASGGVSTVVFILIVFNPLGKMMFGINAVLFGALYMGYSYYMSKKNADNIGHDAHLWGAVFGLLFVLLTVPRAFILMLEQIGLEYF